MTGLLHIADEAGWAEAERAGRIARPAGGFIHLCTEAQLAFVLGRHFAGRRGLVVLGIEAAGLDVRWEESEPGMAPFPHLYEDLAVSLVRAVERR